MLTITIEEPNCVPVESTQKKSRYFLTYLTMCVFGLAVFALLIWGAKETTSSHRRLVSPKKIYNAQGEKYLFETERASTFVFVCRKARHNLNVAMGGWSWKGSQTYKFTFKIGTKKEFKGKLLAKLVRTRDGMTQYAYIEKIGETKVISNNERIVEEGSEKGSLNISRTKFFMKTLKSGISALWGGKMCSRWVYYNMNTPAADGKYEKYFKGAKINKFEEFMQKVIDVAECNNYYDDGSLKIDLGTRKTRTFVSHIDEFKILSDTDRKDHVKFYSYAINRQIKFKLLYSQNKMKAGMEDYFGSW